LVYLRMLMNYRITIGCKSTKHIKIPILPNEPYPKYILRELYDDKPTHVYIIKGSLYENLKNINKLNIFYNKRDNIYFAKYSVDSSFVIKPLYDYTSQMYEFIQLDREIINSVLSPDDTYVKSPNGNIYVIYKGTTDIKNNDGVSYIAYNYTKNRVVYKSMGVNHDDSVRIAAIANSFVPIITTKGEKIYIELINLIDESIDIIEYNLNDFMHKLPGLIEGEISKSLIKEITKSSITGAINWDKEPEYILTKYKGLIPIYKKAILHLDVLEEDEFFRISNAIAITIAFENDELILELSIGKESYIEIQNDKYDRLKVKSDFVLLIKKYKLTEKYNITKSRTYEISKVGENFIFLGKNLYMPKYDNSNDYIAIDQYETEVSFQHVNLLLTYDHILLSNPSSFLKLTSSITMCDVDTSSHKIKYVACNLRDKYRFFLLKLRNVYNQYIKTTSLGQKKDTIILKKE